MKGNPRIIIYSKSKVIIEMYGEIKKIDNAIIEIDYFEILGKSLNITRLNDYMIEVMGEIDNVKII